MRESRTIEVVGRMHHLVAEGCCRVLDQGDVAAELHREPAGRRDAGVRQNQQKIAALEAASPHAAQSTVAEECVPAGRGGLGRSNYRLIITASGRPGGL